MGDTSTFTECVNVSSNVVVFNNVSEINSMSNTPSGEIKQKLKKIKSQDGDETLALKITKGSIFKIRPIIHS